VAPQEGTIASMFGSSGETTVDSGATASMFDESDGDNATSSSATTAVVTSTSSTTNATETMTTQDMDTFSGDGPSDATDTTTETTQSKQQLHHHEMCSCPVCLYSQIKIRHTTLHYSLTRQLKINLSHKN